LTGFLGGRIIERQMGQARISAFYGIFVAAALLSAPTLGADEAPPGWHVANPQVLVLVYSSGQGSDQVSLQFAAQVAPEEVRRLIAQAARSGGWEPGPQKVERGLFVSGELWQQLTGQKAKPQPRTLASFAAAGLVNRQAGRLGVQEFLRALRGYSPVRVVYKVGGNFKFAGPAVQDLEGWNAELQRSGETYTYDAALKRAPASAQQRPERGPGEPAKASGSIWGWLCIAAAAVAAGAGVWCWLGREASKKRRRGDTSGCGT
jgi:hypothetical protein